MRTEVVEGVPQQIQGFAVGDEEVDRLTGVARRRAFQDHREVVGDPQSGDLRQPVEAGMTRCRVTRQVQAARRFAFGFVQIGHCQGERPGERAGQ
ncbi:hypothetical protein DMH04_49735 [Kibdelosporangium aridum]|uniref:Uncharacterized protein n=1 Tax=Kibdelosporangium aridum TaxID=2030 RepID=A0A428YC19_KIBAR|nr:hypothetical protein DMH04_49735 [Kibdelosporangium aridum]